MKHPRSVRISLAFSMLLSCAACHRNIVVYHGGPILTMDAKDSVAEALALQGDRIAAVGTETELAPWFQRASRVLDLGGKTMMPGFIDAHSHFPAAGLGAITAELSSPPIGTVNDMDGLVERLREWSVGTSDGRWVVGRGYDDTLLAEGRHPTRVDLDRVSAEHPVAALHVSGHLAAVNSIGLERLGIHRDTPDPVGGRIVRDPVTREPTGVLEETATNELAKLVLEPSILDSVRITRYANALYIAQGVTTAQDGYASPSQLTGLSWLSRLGVIPLRLVVWPDEHAADAILAGTLSARSYDPRWLRIGAVKLIADGSIQGYTAYLTKPYFKPRGDDPDYRGYPRMTRQELFDRVGRYHAAGLQIAVHGNGDAAIDDILDAFEAAQKAHPRSDARHVIVHAQMARDDQLDRMKTLGVIPSFFVLHTYYWGDRHRDLFLGPERAARISPTKSAAERGMRFTLHADTPVTPMEPLRIVWAAVNRRTVAGKELGPEQRIDPRAALRAVTIDAAYQHFEEAEKGSIEPGKLADLVILDRSPLEDPEHIDQISVLETIVGGHPLRRKPPDVSARH
jgi:predicted amidohydrolase YtcJ